MKLQLVLKFKEGLARIMNQWKKLKQYVMMPKQ